MKKKPYLLTLSSVIIFLILTACKSSSVGNTEVVYTGYIIDQMCGVVDKDTTAQSDEKCSMMTMGNGDDKIDFAKNPEKHTNACNLMPSCSKSGFGISIKQADGNYKYFKFDKTGSKLAKSEIVDKTKKKDNISAQVTGVITKDTIKISKISEN